MSTEGVLGAAWLPTDGYIDPAQLTYALADGARQGGCRIFTSTRVTGIEVRDGRVRGVRTDRGDVEAEVVVDAGGMYAAEIARMAGVRVPLIPMSHQYLVTQPLEAVREARQEVRRTFDSRIANKRSGGPGAFADFAGPRPARLLPRGRGRAGDGRLRAAQRAGVPPRWPGPGRGDPADFNGRLLEEDWERFEEITENSKRRVPAMDRDHRHQADQRPRGVHARQRVLPRRDRGRRLLRLRRLLRPRSGRGRRDRQSRRRVDRRGRAEPRPLAHGHPPLRRPVPLPRLHPRADQGDLRDLLRHPLSPPRAAGGAAAADLPGQRLAPRARRRLRREVGLGASQLVRAQRRRRGRGAAAAWLGGAALVAGDRRRAPRHPRGGRALRRVLLRQARDRGAGSGVLPRTPLRQPGRPRGRARSPTPRCSTTAAASSATSPSPASARSASRSSPAPPSATTTASGCAATSRTSDEVRIHDVTSQWACFGIWGPRAREVLAAAHSPGPRQRGLPLHVCCGRRRSATCRCGCCGSPTSASSAGRSTARPSTGWGCGGRCGRRGSRTGSSPAATGRSTASGSRRATASGAPTSPRTRPPTKAASASASSSTSRRLRRPGRAARGRGARAPRPPALPHPRRPALDRPRQRAGPDRRRGRRPGHDRRLRLHRRALDRLRLPAAGAGRARDGGRGRDLRPLGRGRGGERSRSSTRRASGSGPRRSSARAAAAPAAARRGCARCPRCARASAAPPARRRPCAAP